MQITGVSGGESGRATYFSIYLKNKVRKISHHLKIGALSLQELLNHPSQIIINAGRTVSGDIAGNSTALGTKRSFMCIERQ